MNSAVGQTKSAFQYSSHRILPRDLNNRNFRRSISNICDQRCEGEDLENLELKGVTIWNAIRLIQKDNGLFLKLNDPTFTLNQFDYQPETDRNYIHYTLAYDCTNYPGTANTQRATSTASLSRTNLKFSTSVVPYQKNGFSAEGEGVLSSNNQMLTVTAKGWCSFKYFVSVFPSVPLEDDNSITGSGFKIKKKIVHDFLELKWNSANPFTKNGNFHGLKRLENASFGEIDWFKFFCTNHARKILWPRTKTYFSIDFEPWTGEHLLPVTF